MAGGGEVVEDGIRAGDIVREGFACEEEDHGGSGWVAGGVG